MKVSKKEQKAFVKERKRYIKASGKLNMDRNTTRQEYSDLMDEYLLVRREIQAFSIDNEMAMKEITTNEEWDNIMNAILEKTTKNKVKKKMAGESRKFFDKVIFNCKRNIEDESRRELVIASISDFRKKVDESIPAISEASYKNLETIRNYDAARADYEEVGKSLHKIRSEIMDAFLDTRFELIENTTEQEWKKVIKEFNKLVKKDMIS